MPLAGLIAWQSLIDTAAVKAGHRVLVQAAAGGVGNLAVQIAKHAGAYVIGTAAPGDQAFLAELGVDQPIDYTRTNVADEVTPASMWSSTWSGRPGRRGLGAGTARWRPADQRAKCR